MRCPNKHVGVGQVHGCGAHECCHTPLEHDHRDTMRGGESPNALEVTARGEDALQLSRSGRGARGTRPRRDGRYERAAAQPLRARSRSEEHTSELQSLAYLVSPLLLEKKN